MLNYNGTDHSDVEKEPILIIDNVIITMDNITQVKRFIPPDQQVEVREGDGLSIYLLTRPPEMSGRRLTVWFSKGVAAIESFDGESIWGEWNAEAKLFLCEDTKKIQYDNGAILFGRKAYNHFGVCGIFFNGTFHPTA
jgi:hypothetical protein